MQQSPSEKNYEVIIFVPDPRAPTNVHVFSAGVGISFEKILFDSYSAFILNKCIKLGADDE